MAGRVDAETRRLVEEALDEASALLNAHRATLDRLAERLCEHETVNGSEVTAMPAEDANRAPDKIADQDGVAAPGGSPGQEPSMWHRVRRGGTTGVPGSATMGKPEANNGHERKDAPHLG